MAFGNDTTSTFDRFRDENRYAFNLISDRLDRHQIAIKYAYRCIEDEVKYEIFGTRNKEEGLGTGSSEQFTEFELSLAKPSEDLMILIKNTLTNSHRCRASIDKKLGIQYYNNTPYYYGVDIYGDVHKTGQEWKVRLREELEERYFKNDILGRDVFDIDKMVYVSWYNPGFVESSQSSRSDTVINFNEDRSYIVEIDALLLRYANSIPENELSKLMESICIMVTDKVFRLLANEDVYAKMVIKYVKDLYIDAYTGTSPKTIYMALLCSKVYCDGVNGLSGKEDTRTMEEILNRADISIRNTGSMDGIGRAANSVFSLLNRNAGRGRFLERCMDTVVEYIEESKGTIVNSLNKNKKFTYNVLPRAIHKVADKVVHAGVECKMPSLEYVYQYTDMIYRMENEDYGKYTIIGMESDGKFEAYKKKTRGELLKGLTDRERSNYIKYESEVTRYKSDALNTKDNARKNALFIRSRGLGKVILLEMNKTSNEFYLDLLASLEEMRYSIDQELSKRDFVRERNTRMYGQVIPSSDWDY